MTASRSYYNENDPFAAAWLRRLIQAQLVADGDVDERSIADVRPDDLAGYSQCHFFAGIGGWSCALRLAGWPDSRHAWTGSCPCQPFSSAGAQTGGSDPRDLWPAWFQLIKECRPVVCFGEQVEAAIAHGWYDRICDDMEPEGYAVGAVGLPAASVGTFHLRQRLWFVGHLSGVGQADTNETGLREFGRQGLSSDGLPSLGNDVDGRCPNGVGQADATERGQRIDRSASRSAGHADERVTPCGVGLADPSGPRHARGGSESLHGDRDRQGPLAGADGRRASCGDALGVTISEGLERHAGDVREGDQSRRQRTDSARPITEASPSSRFWSSAEWLPCRDGKSRPVEPGTFPLVDGLPASVGRLSAEQRRAAEMGGLDAKSLGLAKANRVGRLRGYGNAIVPDVAAEFIQAYMEVESCR